MMDFEYSSCAVFLYFAGHSYHRYDHFFKAHPAMLEGIAIVVHEVIVIIWITQVTVLLCKNK